VVAERDQRFHRMQADLDRLLKAHLKGGRP
jgi:hypothetical protein